MFFMFPGCKVTTFYSFIAYPNYGVANPNYGRPSPSVLSKMIPSLRQRQPRSVLVR